MDFKPFPKLARLNREIVVTEKIDGTNAQVYIVDVHDSTYVAGVPFIAHGPSQFPDHTQVMFAGSRTRWITPENDNMGFAKWVKDHAEELFQLGPGQHFGEWWGGKIQRGYGLPAGEKRFSLFNTSRWFDTHNMFATGITDDQLKDGMVFAPACCYVVPTLYRGQFSQAAIEWHLSELRVKGSVAAPGFMKPEGIVVYHTAANQMFKVTLENDEQPKSLARAA